MFPSYCHQIIIPNRHRIVSLHLSKLWAIKKFVKYVTRNLSFGRLESLVFDDITTEELRTLLPQPTSQSRLVALKIGLEDKWNYWIDIYPLIFQLPFLK
jgi:hypothetical protein